MPDDCMTTSVVPELCSASPDDVVVYCRSRQISGVDDRLQSFTKLERATRITDRKSNQRETSRIFIFVAVTASDNEMVFKETFS